MRLFAEHGYDRTSMRAVAAAAGVDQRLVAHYFGSKAELFVEVFTPPFDPDEAVPRLFAGGPAGVGERLARFVVGNFEDPGARGRMIGLIRAAASEPAAAAMVRGLIGRIFLARIAHGLGTGDAALRASLAGSQVVGLAMARYVVGVEPLASAPAETVIAMIAPTLQRYLVDPLPAAAGPAGG